MSIVKKIPLILFAFLCSYTLRAQQFDYTVSCDSSGTYQELSSQTILNTNNSAWMNVTGTSASIKTAATH
ncbi:MAG: hypothetical protein FD123_484 [Bacteroidetes bacterium]|nr:MAG: hypothetical protein FD123_484 [Bacteroidota bacterium]